jgi:hypothetical protein
MRNGVAGTIGMSAAINDINLSIMSNLGPKIICPFIPSYRLIKSPIPYGPSPKGILSIIVRNAIDVLDILS